MKRLLIPFGTAAMLGACAGLTDLPGGYAPEAHPAEGLAVISLSLHGQDISKVSAFEYRLRERIPEDESAVVSRTRYDSARQQARAAGSVDVGKPASQRILVAGANSAEPLDVLENGRRVGRLAILRLPPGAYEIYDWRLTEKVTGGEREQSPAREFSYRFRIEPGKTKYLGRLAMQLGDRSTQRLRLDDQRQEDLRLLQNKRPEFGALAVTHEVGKLLQ